MCSESGAKSVSEKGKRPWSGPRHFRVPDASRFNCEDRSRLLITCVSRPDAQPSPPSSMVPKGTAIKNNSMSVVKARAKSYI